MNGMGILFKYLSTFCAIVELVGIVFGPCDGRKIFFSPTLSRNERFLTRYGSSECFGYCVKQPAFDPPIYFCKSFFQNTKKRYPTPWYLIPESVYSSSKLNYLQIKVIFEQCAVYLKLRTQIKIMPGKKLKETKNQEIAVKM